MEVLSFKLWNSLPSNNFSFCEYDLIYRSSVWLRLYHSFRGVCLLAQFLLAFASCSFTFLLNLKLLDNGEGGGIYIVSFVKIPPLGLDTRNFCTVDRISASMGLGNFCTVDKNKSSQNIVYEFTSNIFCSRLLYFGSIFYEFILTLKCSLTPPPWVICTLFCVFV